MPTGKVVLGNRDCLHNECFETPGAVDSLTMLVFNCHREFFKKYLLGLRDEC